MFGFKHTTRGSLILASVLAVTSGYTFAQPNGQGPKDGERPARRQADDKPKPGEGEGMRRGPRDGEGMGRGARDGEGMIRRFFAGMDLTDDQKAQIQGVLKKHSDERRAWHEEHKQAFQTLREEMRDARQAKDEQAMKAVRDEVKSLMDSAPKPDAANEEVRAILTDEQKAVFDERVEKVRERAEQWRERRPDGPRPGMGPDGDGPPRGMGPDGERPPRPAAQLFGNLNLTDDQRTQLREIMRSEDKTRDEKIDAVREILTDKQKAQLDENIEKMRRFREEAGPPDDRPRRGGPDGEGRRRGPGGPGGDQLDL